MFRSSNPMLQTKNYNMAGASSDNMTITGTVNKTLILFALLLCTFIYTWNQIMTEGLVGNVMPMIIGSAIFGFVLYLVTIFKKNWAPITAPVYALVEGVILGTISSMYELRMPGIVFNAVTLTFAVFAVMLLSYRWGFLKATPMFKKCVFFGTAAIGIVYLVGFIMSFFGTSIPMIHSAGPIGIGFSLFVVGLAALNLIMDFDFIEQSARMRSPKYMEWFSAFGLLITLIWLYLEILRLLSKLNKRR
ncbi:Bax1 inhibitor-like family protein [Bacteriovorax sp. BSW11_IV]|uniref:Bax inhibitor-1/YccA family protein n=1 Tax=Bacteriovorax sp. BSW11_IV TaxID=1353529 RepID=UPI00038A142D|nr:Bax inhibitor-1/YccA family protein [Bacteriovorax sp. BSW11_IV]EQC42996.1 Bax1 inhibitor-like family protein [Bacteriovorax sp. BSW11_IV]